MNIEKKILERLEDLIEQGNRVISTRKPPPPHVRGRDRIDIQLANQWFTSCINLLSRVFGTDSEYCINMKGHYKNYPCYNDVNMAFGVLKAAKEDYEKESIFDLKSLIEAEVFDDFLEQAEHLLKLDYFQPAAVIAGSVLEDGLRKICKKNKIELGSKPKLDSMNSKLAKAGIYNKLTQKKITALADIRNSAAHGKWNEFDKDEVEDMIKSIRSFMEKNY